MIKSSPLSILSKTVYLQSQQWRIAARIAHLPLFVDAGIALLLHERLTVLRWTREGTGQNTVSETQKL
jgi:hypothetical protein